MAKIDDQELINYIIEVQFSYIYFQFSKRNIKAVNQSELSPEKDLHPRKKKIKLEIESIERNLNRSQKRKLVSDKSHRKLIQKFPNITETLPVKIEKKCLDLYIPNINLSNLAIKEENLELIHRVLSYLNQPELFKNSKFETAIFLIDDIDSILAGSADLSSLARQEERRLVSQLCDCMDETASRFPKILVFLTTSNISVVDSSLRRPGRFEYEIGISMPDEKIRAKMLTIMTHNFILDQDINLEKIARLTPGYVAGDLLACVREAALISLEHIHFLYICLAPITYPALFTSLGLHASTGTLLVGPPGCGKTMVAKAIAQVDGLNFISVRGPELLNSYVGESERAVRNLFSRAQIAEPCVIFFDEIDSLCPKRSDDSSNNSSSRLVNQLLTEMDGILKRNRVFIIGATNRPGIFKAINIPDIIDSAILRKG
ncbi:hypothetical protein MXB_4496, partial [Myxobolus squamalis]